MAIKDNVKRSKMDLISKRSQKGLISPVILGSLVSLVFLIYWMRTRDSSNRPLEWKTDFKLKSGRPESERIEINFKRKSRRLGGRN